MSDNRKEKRRQRADETAPKQRNWGMLALYAVLIVGAFVLVFYLGRRSQHKYDGLAKCLSDRGVKMYGAWWCPHCQEQKEKFGASYEYLPYIECGIKGDTKGRSQVCLDADVHRYPTWQFPPTGERHEGTMSLEALSEKSGCPLP